MRKTNNCGRLVAQFYSEQEQGKGLCYSNNLAQPQMLRKMSNLQQLLGKDHKFGNTTMPAQDDSPALNSRSTQLAVP